MVVVALLALLVASQYKLTKAPFPLPPHIHDPLNSLKCGGCINSTLHASQKHDSLKKISFPTNRRI
ncbi:hypothetical protein HK098_006514, partial [Nowakowskiella sp. JEL0407]